LPDYVDQATGVPLADDPNFSHRDTPGLPSDWLRRCPHHPSFGPPSTVSVPVPPRFPPFPALLSPSEPAVPLAPVGARSVSGADDIPANESVVGVHAVVELDLTDHGDGADDDIVDLAPADDGEDFVDLTTEDEDVTVASEDLDSLDPLVYSSSARDRDQSRGMGNYLRAPHAVFSPDSKRSRLNATALERSPVVTYYIFPLPTSISLTAAPTDSVPLVRRSTRARRLPPLEPARARSDSRPRVPVSQ
jgi:hypothetical protein